MQLLEWQGQAWVWESGRLGFSPGPAASWLPGRLLSCEKAPGQAHGGHPGDGRPLLLSPLSEATQVMQMVAGKGGDRKCLGGPPSGLS